MKSFDLLNPVTKILHKGVLFKVVILTTGTLYKNVGVELSTAINIHVFYMFLNKVMSLRRKAVLWNWFR